MNVIDLFAGAGGWDLGARDLGFDPLGIELMDEACATREAAGLRTVQADVAAIDPLDYPCDGLIASPPCQAYSMAGNGAGRRDVDLVAACARDLTDGTDARAEYAELCEDERSVLVVEPLRWTLALQPRWLALEQVPPVLPLWELFAELLRGRGYYCWTGVLSAERYGVPQTRKRAFLIASLDGPVHPPEPTHQKYVPGMHARTQDADLFGGGLKPWVSMAQALGWTDGPEPSPAPAVTGGGGMTGGIEVFASKGARSRVERSISPEPRRAFHIAKGQGMNERYGQRPDTPTTQPAPTITSRARAAQWRPMSINNDRPERRAAGAATWVTERPATTLNGDLRISEPGYHGPNVSGSQQANAIRVTEREAAILQSFPPDYPWQGSRSRKFLQIGNAVPPAMARAVLAAAIKPSDVPTTTREQA